MKKTFSKFLATASAVSMLASLSAVVNADEATEVAYSFNTSTCEHGVVIEGVVNGDDVESIVIPEKIGEANVVGIADFAFADLDSLVTIDTQVATELTPEHVSTLAFVTKASLTDYFTTLFGENPDKNFVLTVIANEVYGEKAEGEEWTADELAAVEAKMIAQAELAGATIPEDFSDVDALMEAAAIMFQNEEAMSITDKTAEALDIWETSITNNKVEVLYTDDSKIKDVIQNITVSLPILLGDANLDGKVNVRDAAFIASKLAKAEGDDLTAEADFNEDGKTNVRDAAAIATALAKGEIAQ